MMIKISHLDFRFSYSIGATITGTGDGIHLVMECM